MAYSLDFRKRVFSLKEERELTFKETSKLFGIDIRTLFRWQQRLEPKIAREKPATKIDMQDSKRIWKRILIGFSTSVPKTIASVRPLSFMHLRACLVKNACIFVS